MPSASENDVDDRPKRQSYELHTVPDEKNDQHIEPEWSGLTAEVNREASAHYVGSGDDRGRDNRVDPPMSTNLTRQNVSRRSAARREGKTCVSACRYGWSRTT